MRILFAGTPSVAVPSLRALVEADDIEVVAVLTRPDAPSGRGRKLKPSDVKVCAQELGIPVYEDNPNSDEWLATLDKLDVEAAAVVAYGKILRQPVLDAVEYGWFNLHFSRLPQLRGAAPAQRAIWEGLSETGATVFQLTAGMDEGPILEQSHTRIREDETAGALLERMGREQATLLVRALQKVAQGSAQFKPQRVQGASVAAKITHEDAHIDLTKSAQQVAAQIRACSPNPGAWAMLHESITEGAEPTLLRVLNAIAVPDEDVAGIVERVFVGDAAHMPGRIAADKKHVWITVADGLVQLLEVQAQGKKRMIAADWARGARLSETAIIK